MFKALLRPMSWRGALATGVAVAIALVLLRLI
jgi:hypothetical protein